MGSPMSPVVRLTGHVGPASLYPPLSPGVSFLASQQAPEDSRCTGSCPGAWALHQSRASRLLSWESSRLEPELTATHPPPLTNPSQMWLHLWLLESIGCPVFSLCPSSLSRTFIPGLWISAPLCHIVCWHLGPWGPSDHGGRCCYWGTRLPCTWAPAAAATSCVKAQPWGDSPPSQRIQPGDFSSCELICTTKMTRPGAPGPHPAQWWVLPRLSLRIHLWAPQDCPTEETPPEPTEFHTQVFHILCSQFCQCWVHPILLCFFFESAQLFTFNISLLSQTLSFPWLMIWGASYIFSNTLLTKHLILRTGVHLCQYNVVQLLSCVQLCDPVDYSTPGFPVLHNLSEFAQTHVHWVSDTI